MKKNKENILITRKLSESSPLWQLATEHHSVMAQSFLDIRPVIITAIPQAEVYFYYSKNAAIYFLKAIKELGLDLSSATHAAMGNGTADVLKKHKTTPAFIGTGSPAVVADQLIDNYAHTSICFVRAERSTQSIQKKWPSKFSELVVYKAIPKPIKISDKVHTLFATSPMNLDLAIKSIDVHSLKRVICIGPTTYAAALKLTDVDIIIANESNENSMLAAYLEAIQA